jgi:hypothetical protein
MELCAKVDKESDTFFFWHLVPKWVDGPKKPRRLPVGVASSGITSGSGDMSEDQSRIVRLDRVMGNSGLVRRVAREFDHLGVVPDSSGLGN